MHTRGQSLALSFDLVFLSLGDRIVPKTQFFRCRMRSQFPKNAAIHPIRSQALLSRNRNPQYTVLKLFALKSAQDTIAKNHTTDAFLPWSYFCEAFLLLGQCFCCACVAYNPPPAAREPPLHKGACFKPILYASIVDTLNVVSSRTSSRTRTVSIAVKMVTLFSVAAIRISAPSLICPCEPMSRVLRT